MAGPLPTSPEWWPERTRDALPYGVVSWCFSQCPHTPVDQLRYMPPPCICTISTPVQPVVPWSAAAPTSASAH